MGSSYSGQTQDNIAIAQAKAVSSQGQVESKIEIFGAILIAILILLAIVLCYGIRLRCQNRVRSWLRREIVTTLPPVYKIQAPQQQQTPPNIVIS